MLPKESVEDEDEVLTALSEELGNFVEFVGGPECGHVLLSPLENLAAIEEPLVREKVSGLGVFLPCQPGTAKRQTREEVTDTASLRLLSLSTRFAKICRALRSKSSSSPSSSVCPRPTGSPPRSLPPGCSPHLTARPLQRFKKVCGSSSRNSYTTTPQWCAGRRRQTLPNSWLPCPRRLLLLR